MGGAAAVSVPRSTGTVVAVVASVPSPSSQAAAALARRLLAPIVASEEEAAAAGSARRLLKWSTATSQPAGDPEDRGRTPQADFPGRPAGLGSRARARPNPLKAGGGTILP